MKNQPPAFSCCSFFRYAFTAILFALLLTGCERNRWQHLYVEKKDRPATLEWVSNGPSLLNIHFTSQSIGWGTTFDGSLWHTEDGGRNWTEKFISEDFEATLIQFLSDGKRGWMIGRRKENRGSLLLTTSNGGTKWDQVYQDSDSRWIFLSFSSDTSGCIADKQSIQCTNNGGLNWSKKSAPTGSEWAGLHFLNNGQRGWAWTEDHSGYLESSKGIDQPIQNLIVTTSDGGQTWTTLGQPISDQLVALDFLNEKDGWALTNTAFGGFDAVRGEIVRDTFLRTEDGGATWQQLPEKLNAGLVDFRFADAKRGWAVGSADLSRHRRTPSSSVLLYTEDGGQSWLPGSPALDVDLIDLEMLPGGNEVWALGKAGVLMHTRDGIQWSAVTKNTLANLLSIRFASDGHKGWALSSDGAILHSSNSGQNWAVQYQPSKASNSEGFWDLQIDKNGQRGWAVISSKSCSAGAAELLSTDNGKDWQSRCMEMPGTVRATDLTTDSKGWAVVAKRVPARSDSTEATSYYLLFTSNRGESWHQQYEFPQDSFPTAAYFSSNGTHVWIVTYDGKLLQTQNSGDSWGELKVEDFTKNGFLINALYFTDDGQHGWAAGEVQDSTSRRLVLHTADNGLNWETQAIGNLEFGAVTAINFLPDGLRGWVIGANGKLFYTSDAGEHWQSQPNIGGVDSELKAFHFINDEQGLRAWVVGKNGTIVRSSGSKLHPIVTQFQVISTAKGVDLKWRLGDDTPLLKRKPEELEWQIEFCAHKDCPSGDWQHLMRWQALTPDRSDGSPVFHHSWNPADSRIAPGTQIHYRIGIYDGSQWLAPQALGAFTYQPLWDRLETWQKTIVIVVAVLLAYVLVCLILLWVHPWALLWMNEHLSVRNLIEPLLPDPARGVIPTTLVLAPWFAKRSRVNQAWNNRYLSQPKLRISGLSTAIREHYVTQDATLDAWVKKHQKAAEKTFLAKDTVDKRSKHIPLPVRLETEQERTLINRPSPKDFRAFMQLPRLVLSIVGIGGSGKSSLACELARWAMSAKEEERLNTHPMIPVLVEEDTTDLSACIKKQLLIISEQDVPDELLKSLLDKKRLLVLVDALSEKSQTMQESVRDIHAGWPVNALVITTRRPIDVTGASPVTLRLEEIKTAGLAYFLFEYLKSLKQEELFPGRTPLELADRLLSIMEADGKDLPLTPLLIVLFVNEAINLVEQGKDFDSLPDSIPETMIKYIHRLNTRQKVPNEKLVDATLAVAKFSLGDNYNPHDFERRKAIASLKEKSLWSDSYDVLQELVECGILEQHESAGTATYRFNFDPVAEYMTGIERVRALMDSKAEWEQWLQTVRSTEGYPRIMDGFLAALKVCISTYQKQFNLPPLQISENSEPHPTPSPKPEVVISSAR
jgi:photosystem II stability/assembly factor-like uncharacterized protein